MPDIFDTSIDALINDQITSRSPELQAKRQTKVTLMLNISNEIAANAEAKSTKLDAQLDKLDEALNEAREALAIAQAAYNADNSLSYAVSIAEARFARALRRRDNTDALVNQLSAFNLAITTTNTDIAESIR
jgi:hypothetical protein